MVWENGDDFIAKMKREKKRGQGFSLPEEQPIGRIYFIAERDSNDRDKAIKIGYSNKPARRKRTLKTGNSDQLVILLDIPGTIPEEKMLHRLLQKHRKTREFFYPHDEVYHVMRICREYGRVPPMIRAINEDTFAGITSGSFGVSGEEGSVKEGSVKEVDDNESGNGSKGERGRGGDSIEELCK